MTDLETMPADVDLDPVETTETGEPTSAHIVKTKRGENAAHLVESDDARRSIDIFSKQGAPVVAVNDGVIKKIGQNKKLGRYVLLQDVYGNRYTYAHLGEVSIERASVRRCGDVPFWVTE